MCHRAYVLAPYFSSFISMTSHRLSRIQLYPCMLMTPVCVMDPLIFNIDLSKLDTWLQGKKLTLNVAKTNFMLIATKQKHETLECQNEELDLKIRNKKLDIVQTTKYLGLQIERFLDWKKQIKAVSTQVSRAVRFLKYTKSFLPKASLKTLYMGVIEPHFRYCRSVWGCCGSTEISKLQKLQNRAARVITNSSFDAPSRPLIQELG